MTQVITSTEALAVQYQQHLRTSLPFSRTNRGQGLIDIFLIPPEPTATAGETRAAMQSLVDQGVLFDYRYIDSKPQAAILAIRA
jgi:hypothetical protein